MTTASVAIAELAIIVISLSYRIRRD